MFYLKIIYPKAVVPSLFVPADRSMYHNFTAAREYSMMVALFKQPKWSYHYEPLGQGCYRTVCSFAQSPTLSLMLQCSRSMHPTVSGVSRGLSQGGKA